MVFAVSSIAGSPSGRRLQLVESPFIASSKQFEEEYSNALERIPFRKFGRNPQISSVSDEDIWAAGGIYSGWLQAPERIRIRAGGNPADDVNGLGARRVVLQPHDAEFNWINDETSVVLETAGASASAFTENSYQRLTRACVKEVGQYANGVVTGANAGIITLEGESGTTLAIIDTATSVTQLTMFTVPKDHALWLDAVIISVDSNQSANCRMYVREGANVNTAPFSPRQTLFTFDGAIGVSLVEFDFNARFPAFTDIWWNSQANANNTSVTIEYIGLLLRLS